MSANPKFAGEEFLVLTPEVMATLRNIAGQQNLIQILAPGSPDHKIATKVLLLLQDSLHALSVAQAAVEGIRRSRLD